jgi:predicted TIM-barrel fold metal-dependent hydrolase
MSAPEKPLVVDAHAHSAGEFYRGEDIVRTLDELGVDEVILCPGPINEPRKWPVPNLARVFRERGPGLAGSRSLRLTSGYVARRFDFAASNAYVASLARRFPSRIVQACWVDPGDEAQLSELASRFKEWGFRALKVHQSFQRVPSDAPGMHALARFAGEKGLPIFVHLFSKEDAEALLVLAAAHPETTFVVAHLLALDVFAVAGPEARENIFLDISPPSMTPRRLVLRALRAFGAGRLLMGSDTPYGQNNLKEALTLVRGLAIPGEDQRLILGENARRVYRL